MPRGTTAPAEGIISLYFHWRTVLSMRFPRAQHRVRPVLLVHVLLASLCTACGNTSETVTPRGPAQSLPAGELHSGDTLNEATFSGSPQPPAVLLRAFKQFEEPGLRLHEVEFANAVALLVVEIDTSRFTPTLITGSNNSLGISARQALARENMVLVVGSSFVSELRSLSPVGLLQFEGRQLSELQLHGYTRILGIRETALGVVASRDFHRGMFDSAIQVGPGIVERGALDISTADLARLPYFRTFIATCGDSVLVGASQIPMHLYNLGEQLLAFTSRSGMPGDEVGHLAGDREAVLALGSGGQIAYLGHPETGKAALVGFQRQTR